MELFKIIYSLAGDLARYQYWVEAESKSDAERKFFIDNNDPDGLNLDIWYIE